MAVAGFGLAGGAVAMAGECLPFEPNSAQVEGKLERETFPGPPNYSDVGKGDARETVWLLHLDPPQCFEGAHPDRGDQRGSMATNHIQLVAPLNQAQGLNRLIGQRIWVSGRAFPATTGHHHAPILIRVGTFTPLPEKKR